MEKFGSASSWRYMEKFGPTSSWRYMEKFGGRVATGATGIAGATGSTGAGRSITSQEGLLSIFFRETQEGPRAKSISEKN
jgi:hypothetical protein